MPRKGERLPPEQLAKILATRQRNHGPFLTTEELRERKREQDRRYAATHRKEARLRAAAWYDANRERGKATRRAYENAHRDDARRRLNAWMDKPENRAKHYARVRAHLRAHPEKLQMYDQRRRSRLLGAFVEDVDRREVLRRHNGLCGWCRLPVDPNNFHVDHIVALVLGGEHSYANTQPTHPKCNIAKRVALKERAA